MCAEAEAVMNSIQVKLYAKTNEALIIRSEIQKAKFEAQILRLHLQVQGIEDESLIPAGMGTGGKPRVMDLKCSEHKRLVEWLAQNIDLSSKLAYNVPDPEVNVGGHRALLGRMVQWSLNAAGGLRLSAPLEAEKEFVDILMKTRADRLEADMLEAFADDWLLVTTDLVTGTVATPALFLINKESQKAIVVSAWPHISVVPPPAPVVACFDPNAFFSRAASESSASLPSTPGLTEVFLTDKFGWVSRLHCPEEGGMVWTLQNCVEGSQTRQVEELGVSFSPSDEFTITGPFGCSVISEPAPGPIQRCLMHSLITLALEHGVRVQRNSLPTVTAPSCEEAESSSSSESGESSPTSRPRSMSSGDHVEVQYKGSWLRGILQAVQGELAHVKCDVDEGGVITVAPLDRVRPADFHIECPEADGEQLTEGEFRRW